MSRRTPRRPQEPGLNLSPPELWRLEFSRREGIADGPAADTTSLNFKLGLSRLSVVRLGVELQVELIDAPGVEMKAAYRAVFEIDGAERPAEDIERDLKVVAAHVAPSALYPFLRETLVTTAVKAGLPPVIAPIVNFRRVFDPKEIALPPVPKDRAMASQPSLAGSEKGD